MRRRSDKVIAVVRHGGRHPDPAGAPPAITGLHHHTVYLPVEGEPGSDPTVSAVWMLWVDDAGALDLRWASAAYLVDERPQWGHDEHGGVTRLSFLQAAPGVSREEFGDHWTDVHAPLARRHHPALWRYVQNVVCDRLTPDTPDLDGVAELSFRVVEDLRQRMYDSEDGRRVVGADLRTFIDLAAGWRVLTAEHVVPDSNTF